MRTLLIIFVSILLTMCEVLYAQESVNASRRTAIVTAIEKVAPAVVTINVVDIQTERVVEPFFRDFYGLFEFPLGRSKIQKRALESLGTGFIFDAKGHIITNYHVLQGADLISSVTLPDGRELEVKLLGADVRSDIAVLKTTETNLPYAPLGNSEDLMIGEWVIAIGNPFGNLMRDRQPSVSVGVISATQRRIHSEVGEGERLYQGMIQTDAAINPGNSGGPLVNALGKVVGMNTMIFSSSGGNQGLGFAVPAHRVRRVAEEIIQYGRRRNPWFGFHGDAVASLSSYSLRQFGVMVDSGVLVTEIMRDCPAYMAGLRLGDVIVSVNGERTAYPQEIDFVNWALFVGDPVRMEVDRQGKRLTLEFQVEEINAP